LVSIFINFVVSGNFKNFGYYSELLIGIGYLCIGIAFIYFGEKMADFIKSTKTPESQEENERSQKISFKVIKYINYIKKY